MEEKHIVSFSGGKDSTAMLFMMIEKKMRIDEILFCDTGEEFDEMYDHIAKVEKLIKRKITILEFDKPFMHLMLDHKVNRRDGNIRKGYRWCGAMCRWGTTEKTRIIKNYLKQYENVVEYHGIAADEPQRIKTDSGRNIRYPLAEWGITEKQALEYCYNKGFTWGGLYKYLDRVSCWCCRNKNLKELKNYYYHLPQYWERLKELQTKIEEPYRKDYSLEELEQRFKKEGLQIKIS